ncbi:DUF72 domain-containing protein [Stenotrophomonas sp. ZAC14D2_NAIMI4_7]|uniref:DUF72 domain-containing protein n=1 Tax=Stenotrophomonas sp. ZAC14D2_NAIMI4_7 TaxID=2072405 RepID=UPI000D53D6B6|nr:DUF72 domain-containing protein [Stenotrophomonas sp. ZAC14D2_NAIMI4_7]AWH17658.1 DUF72 domain-containing protein [Stenotrophomonas sp. ZAC14D2_NAIMI4_7]
MSRQDTVEAPSDLRVGCAGWSLPSANAGKFGPGQTALQRYATRFNVVEINSSFYRQHKPETYARWAQSVPAGFRFCVKLPQTISHERALLGAAPLLDGFLRGVERLGDRLGVLLLQLPPSAAYNGRVASAFFRALRYRSSAPVACEPRHQSWFTAQADSLMARHDVARVAADPARYPLAGQPGGARHWSYWRWHGRPRMYYSAYEAADLRDLAGRCSESARTGPAWVILDNTAQGHAVANALELQGLLQPTRRTRPR